MAMGDSTDDSSHKCSIAERSSRHMPQQQQQPETASNPKRGLTEKRKASSDIGEKVILFGRGKSIRQRAANTRLVNFIDIFREHYSSSGPFERNQIVRRIVEMLQNDGYSFRIRKQKQKQTYAPRSTTTVVSESSDEMEDDGDEGVVVVFDNRNSWVEASPSQVDKRIAQLFRKSPGQFQEQNHHQTELSHMKALNLAIFSAIDTSSLAQELRDCPSPKSTLVLSPSSSSSSIDPTFSLSPTPDPQIERQFCLPPSSLPGPTASTPSIGHQSEKERSAPTAHRHSSENIAPASSALCDRKLLSQQLDTLLTSSKTSPGGKEAETIHCLPRDGVLWSKGTQQIRLLEGNGSSLVPVTSFSLYPNAPQKAFGKKNYESSSVAGKPENDDKSKNHLSGTIGYTQQQVGNLTILRPIVLLPE